MIKKNFTLLSVSAWSGLSALFLLFLIALIALLQPLDGNFHLAIREFLSYPSSLSSLFLSIFIALSAQIFALSIAIHFIKRISVNKGAIPRFLALFLAMPHVAFAISFVFLFSPSGWVIRLLSPWLTGFTRPPDFIFINDPYGISLILVLILKETPFLFFVGLAALNQLPTKAIYQQGATLGYERAASWRYLVLPQLLKMLTLPMLATLIYSLSVVDIALIVGPQRPIVFSQLMHQWFFDPTRAYLLEAHVAAISLLCIAVLLIIIWMLIINTFVHWLINQPKISETTSYFNGIGPALILKIFILIYMCAALVLVVYSISADWRFPMNVPQTINLDGWSTISPSRIIVDTLITAMIAAGASIALSITLLEYQIRRRKFWPDWLICFSLLVPQITVLLGLYAAALKIGLEAGWFLTIIGHIIFIFPYAYIALKEPYSKFNQFQYLAAVSLGAHPIKSWFKVKLPSLKTSVVIAFAIAMASSILQYLPTQVLGAGRVDSVTVRAVTAASGFDRGDAARWALIQLILGFLGFAIAIYVNRKSINNDSKF